jgi:hypothetical protein
MAGVNVKVPGVAGIIESRKAVLAQSVAQQFANLPPIAAPLPTTPDDRMRRPMAGDLGKRLSPIGL